MIHEKPQISDPVLSKRLMDPEQVHGLAAPVEGPAPVAKGFVGPGVPHPDAGVDFDALAEDLKRHGYTRRQRREFLRKLKKNLKRERERATKGADGGEVWDG